MVSKSLATNLVALAIIGASYLSPNYNEIMYLTGLFALSGGITNWLALHMLFEKIPFLIRTMTSDYLFSFFFYLFLL